LAVLQSKWLIPVLLAVVVVAGIANPDVLNRVTELAEPGTSTTGDPRNSFTWRVAYWNQTLELAEGREVTGIGLGMVQRTTPEEKAPHNDYLRVVVEGGLLALAAYIWLIFALVRVGLRAARERKTLRGPPKAAAVGFVACLSALLLLSVVSNVISQVVLIWYVAVITAMASAAHAIAVAESPESSADVGPEPEGAPVAAS
jgi:O-antigen ligase